MVTDVSNNCNYDTIFWFITDSEFGVLFEGMGDDEASCTYHFFSCFQMKFSQTLFYLFLLLLFYSHRIILLLLLFMSKFINSLEGKFCIKLRSINLLWKPSSCSRSKLVTTARSWNKIDCWIIDQNSIRPTLPNVRIRSCCYYYYSKFEMGLLKGTVAALVCLHYCVCIEILLLLSNCEWSGSSFPPPISLQQMNAKQCHVFTDSDLRTARWCSVSRSWASPREPQPDTWPNNDACFQSSDLWCWISYRKTQATSRLLNLYLKPSRLSTWIVLTRAKGKYDDEKRERRFFFAFECRQATLIHT